MLKVLQLLPVISLGILAVGCATSSDEKIDLNEPGALDIILCEEPRPQICTREYDPVCATLKDGSTRTGATGCTSCSDFEVVGYKVGACEAISLN